MYVASLLFSSHQVHAFGEAANVVVSGVRSHCVQSGLVKGAGSSIRRDKQSAAAASSKRNGVGVEIPSDRSSLSSASSSSLADSAAAAVAPPPLVVIFSRGQFECL